MFVFLQQDLSTVLKGHRALLDQLQLLSAVVVDDLKLKHNRIIMISWFVHWYVCKCGSLPIRVVSNALQALVALDVILDGN